MEFQEDYDIILKHAKKKVNFFCLNILPEDLINDAFLKLHDKPYSLQSFLAEINNLSLIEKHNTRNDIAFGEVGGTSGNFIGDSTCTYCKQVKSADEFRIVNRMFGKKQLLTVCKKCEYKKSQDRYIARFGVPYNKPWREAYNKTGKGKIANKKNFTKYVKENRDNWNEYLRKRSKEQSESLTDAYIRKCIRQKYKNMFTETLYHPSFIAEYRQKILEKRLGKEKKVT